MKAGGTMKCSRCGVHDATILIRQVINGKESEYNLCENCAKAIGIAIQSGPGSLSFPGSLLSGNILNALNQLGITSQVNTGVFVPGKAGSGVCANCGTTLAEFREKGKLGCSHCYDAFDGQLSQVFRRIQSGETHRGRKLAEIPESSEIRAIQDRIEHFQDLIKKAVEVENYEEAARCKAEITRLKAEKDRIRAEAGPAPAAADGAAPVKARSRKRTEKPRAEAKGGADGVDGAGRADSADGGTDEEKGGDS